MTEAALRFYHALPSFLQSTAGTLRGYYLAKWRYGRETDRLVEEAIERETWDADEWKKYNDERLAFLLHRAATRVPFYRDLWNERRRNGDRRSWEYLENWPVLEKENLRIAPKAFVSDDCNPAFMFKEHTSGTTGSSLELWWSKKTVRLWYALFEARCRIWNGVSRKDRWAIIGGQLVVPFARSKPPFWVWNGGLKQLYLSAYHIRPEWAPEYLRAIGKYGAVYLFTYPSAAYELAAAARELNCSIPKIKAIITNAEPLYPHQRECISSVFDCPVRETYGMAEIAMNGSECGHGIMHAWPESGITEIETAPEVFARSGAGEFICTGLLNADMPLIRYRVGDGGEVGDGCETCACGRRLPRILSIRGRSDDVITLPDGRRIGRLDPVFKEGLAVLEAQIIQQDYDRFLVRYVKGGDGAARIEDDLRARLEEYLGEVTIEFDEVASIPRTSNGKFRAVISLLRDREDRADGPGVSRGASTGARA
jgi:phenylacetate-CoA ligase